MASGLKKEWRNSSNLAMELLWRVLEEMHAGENEEDKAKDEFDRIELPWDDDQFLTLEADPPWCYEDNGFNGYQSVQEYRIHCPYRTMSFRSILRGGREVIRVMKRDSHYYIWVTKDFLIEGLLTMKMWGGVFKNMIVWLKTSQAGKLTYGMGHWYRNGWEAMLFGTRGQPGRPAQATSQPNWFLAPKPAEIWLPGDVQDSKKHSRKPQAAYDLICRNSPGPRLSLFQRGTRDGFYCWGDEAIEGLEKEWEGEIVQFDPLLSFGVDRDMGDVSMILRSEEIYELRSAIDYIQGQIGDIPAPLQPISDRLNSAAQVLEQVVLETAGEELEAGLAGEVDEEIEQEVEAGPAVLVNCSGCGVDLDPDDSTCPNPECRFFQQESVVIDGSDLIGEVLEIKGEFGLPVLMNPDQIQVVTVAEYVDEIEAQMKSYPKLAELAHEQTTSDLELSPPPDPTPDQAIHEFDAYTLDGKLHYEFMGKEYGPFFGMDSLTDAIKKHKRRMLMTQPHEPWTPEQVKRFRGDESDGIWREKMRVMVENGWITEEDMEELINGQAG